MWWQLLVSVSIAILVLSRSYLHETNGSLINNNGTTPRFKSINEWENQLHIELFEDYKNDVHPDACENGSSCPVVVTFDVQLIRILKANEREQYIQVYLWVNQYWNNPMLQWDPNQYGGVESIHVSPINIWVPDIVLYNSVDGNGQLSGGLGVYKHKVRIASNGKHSWLNPVVFKSLCAMDVSYFPFDDQECILKFGSWSFDASGLDMKPSPNNDNSNTYYIKNGEWELLRITAMRNEKKYQCCEEPFVDVSIAMKLRRQAINYSLTLILPCALLSSLAFLNFVLPPESGERIGLSITVLLSITVFQQLTNQLMPPYDFPYLAQYYLATILETGFSLVATTLILNFYHRSNRHLPWLVRKLVLGFLATILFCGKPIKREEVDMESNEDSSKNDNNSESSDNLSEIRVEWPKSKSQADNKHKSIKNKKKFLRVGLRKGKRHHCALAMESTLVETTAFGLLGPNTSNKLKDAYKEKKRKEAEKKQRERDWLKVARVLDRLFLVMFVIIAISTLLVIFFRAPRFAQH